MIRNFSTGKCYVGSTRDLDSRWESHRTLLEANRHSPKLQKAWNESTPSDWEWEVIEDGIPVIHQFQSEQHWIDTLDAFKNGYNSSPRAGSYVSIDNRGYDYFVEKRKDEIVEMLVMINEGIPYRDIAKRFGVSLGFLTNLKRQHADLLDDLFKANARKMVEIKEKKTHGAERLRAKQIRESEIPRLIGEGKSYREVAALVRCSLGTVSSVMQRAKPPSKD